MIPRKAVILAAGRGSRLGEHSVSLPKPLTRINNIPIIFNLIDHLIACGFSEVVIVDGYLADKLEDHLNRRYTGKIRLTYITNEVYYKTNNLYSLWMAKDHLTQGFYLFEADIFVHRELLRQLVAGIHPDVAVVDRYHKHMNGTVARLTRDGTINRLYMGSEQDEGFNYRNAYKTVNIWRLSAEYAQQRLIPALDRYVQEKEVNVYYEHILREDIAAGWSFKAHKAPKLGWWEIDTPSDVVIAEILFR
jgi:choline kinase